MIGSIFFQKHTSRGFSVKLINASLKSMIHVMRTSQCIWHHKASIFNFMRSWSKWDRPKEELNLSSFYAKPSRGCSIKNVVPEKLLWKWVSQLCRKCSNSIAFSLYKIVFSINQMLKDFEVLTLYPLYGLWKIHRLTFSM